MISAYRKIFINIGVFRDGQFLVESNVYVGDHNDAGAQQEQKRHDHKRPHIFAQQERNVDGFEEIVHTKGRRIVITVHLWVRGYVFHGLGTGEAVAFDAGNKVQTRILERK